MMREAALSVFLLMSLVVAKSKCSINPSLCLGVANKEDEGEKVLFNNEVLVQHKTSRFVNADKREVNVRNTGPTKMTLIDGPNKHRQKNHHHNSSRTTKENFVTLLNKNITSAKSFFDNPRNYLDTSFRNAKNCSINCSIVQAHSGHQYNVQRKPSKTSSLNNWTRIKRRAIHHRFINWKAESERYTVDGKHFNNQQYRETRDEESSFRQKDPSEITFISQNQIHSRSVPPRQITQNREWNTNSSHPPPDPLLFTTQKRSKGGTDQTPTSTTAPQKRQKWSRSIDGKGNLSDVPFRWPDSAYVDGPTAAAGPASQSTRDGDRKGFHLASKDQGSLPRGSQDQSLQGGRFPLDTMDRRLRHKSSRAIRGKDEI